MMFDLRTGLIKALIDAGHNPATAPAVADLAIPFVLKRAADVAYSYAPQTSGPDYGMASDSERADMRDAKSLCHDIADDILALGERT